MRRVCTVLVCALVALISPGCTQSECLITEYDLGASDLLWGVPVEEEMATLLGPFDGTWTWDDGGQILEVPGAGTSFAATATIEIDPTSYRFIEEETIVGTQKLFQDRLAICGEPDGFFAEGTMTVVDMDGVTIATAPILIERSDENHRYLAQVELEQISSFSAALEPRYEFDTERIHGHVRWDTPQGPLEASFGYSGEQALPDTPEGHGAGISAQARVAEFQAD